MFGGDASGLQRPGADWPSDSPTSKGAFPISAQPESPRAAISNQIVRLQSEYYGRGPTRAKTYIVDDLVAVVMEETFTPAERTLIGRGEVDAIKEIRRRFQSAMREQFTSIVEDITGRKVRAFLSETDVESDTSVELFLLGDARVGSSDGSAADPSEDSSRLP